MSGKPTGGEWEFTHTVTDHLGRPCVIDATTRLLIAVVDNEGGGEDENDRNGNLIAEAGTVYNATGLGPRELQQKVAALEAAVDAEQSRWQTAVYELVKSLSGCDSIDGTGCESGDPLDVTLSEIQQAWNVREDAEFDKQPELAALQKDAERWRKLKVILAETCLFTARPVAELDAAIDSMEAEPQ